MIFACRYGLDSESNGLLVVKALPSVISQMTPIYTVFHRKFNQTKIEQNLMDTNEN